MQSCTELMPWQRKVAVLAVVSALPKQGFEPMPSMQMLPEKKTKTGYDQFKDCSKLGLFVFTMVD
jgi:hypothetical protein